MSYERYLQDASDRIQSSDGFAAPNESMVRLNNAYAPFAEAYHQLSGHSSLEVLSDDTSYERTVRAGLVAARRAIILFGQFGSPDGYHALPLVETDATPSDDTGHVALLEYAGQQIGGFDQTSGLFGYDFRFHDKVPAMGVWHAHQEVAAAQQRALLDVTEEIGVRVVAVPLSDDTRASLFMDGIRRNIPNRT